jgi:hypothetical protein
MTALIAVVAHILNGLRAPALFRPTLAALGPLLFVDTGNLDD